MKSHQRLILTSLLLIVIIALLTSCGSGSTTGEPAGDTGATTGGDADEPETDSTPASAQAGVDIQGQLYLGPLSAPYEGFTALFIHEDETVDFVIVCTSDIDVSMWSIGEMTGKSIDSIVTEAEVGRGTARGRIRPDTPDTIEVNITLPGLMLRSEPERTVSGGLYKGELSGFAAALLILPDGTISGFAIVENGDAPVYEYLCVDDSIEGIPDTITATTCDTGVEVTLTLMTE